MTNSTYDNYIQKLKNHPILAKILLVFAVLVFLGAVIGSIATIQKFIIENSNTKEDPYVFHFNNQRITFSGGNGSSVEQAIVVNNSLGSDAAIAAEHYFVKTFFKNFRFTAQALILENNQEYDLLILESPKGNKRHVFFFVSNFFGVPATDGKSLDAHKEIEKRRIN